MNAYDFRMVGDDKVSGADTWVVEAIPRADFKPTQPHADMLKKIKGRIWIEKKDYNWVKVEAEATDTISSFSACFCSAYILDFATRAGNGAHQQ